MTQPREAGWPSDRIVVRGIRGFGRHGILPHEGDLGQEFTVDVAIETDFAAAAATDDLARTVDYGHVAALAHERLVGPPFALIETLADVIAGDVLQVAGVAAVEVTVHKPHAPLPVGFSDVAVTRRRRAPTRIVLGLGSNVGDRASQLQAAIDALTEAEIHLTSASSVVRTAPVGGPDGQGDFFNAVVVGTTALSPYDVLRVCRSIEEAAGRDRAVRWGPRPIDVDILEFGGRRVDEPDLTLPHPRAADRAFVLVPWSQVAPGDRLGRPTGPTVGELASALPADAVHPVNDVVLRLRS